MPNETDTTVRKNNLDETQELPAFPSRRNDSEGPVGDQLVSAQYKALQEAQFLHEETLRQLREEIQAQKERISELTQGQGESSQPQARLDAILLRLSELERKIGEDAPDPLLNEIVHRLASLENGGGRGGDAKVEKLTEQIEELRKRPSAPAADPRTDEMALRIASVEGAMRRTQEVLDGDKLTEQIEALQIASRNNSEQVSTELSALRAQLEAAQSQEQPDWTGRLDEIENRLKAVSENDAATEELKELSARLTQLEQSQADDASGTRLAEVSDKMEELGGKLDATADSATVSELQQKLSEIESQLSASAENPQSDALAARVDQLQQALETRPAPADLEALQTRLAALETSAPSTDSSEALIELRERYDALADKLATVADTTAFESRVAAVEAQVKAAPAESSVDIEALQQRLTALEQTGQTPESGEAIAELRERCDALADKIATISESAAEAGEPADLQELRQRLTDLEGEQPRENDGRLAELTARLRSLELQTEQFATAADPSRLDRLSSRLDQLELTGGSNGLTNQINELRERVAGLTSQGAATGGDEPSAQALEGITERIAQLEIASPAALERLSRVEEQIQNAPDGGSDQADAIAELRQRIDQMGNVAPSEDASASDVLHELGLRIQALERGTGDSGQSNDGQTSVLAQRLEQLESRINETASGPRVEIQGIADRLTFLEQSGGGAGDGDDSSSSRLFEQVVSRYETLEQRFASLEANNSGQNETAGEIAVLRQELVDLKENGTTGEGIPENFVGKLAEKISSGIAHSEVKAIQTQMYVVYFFLALVGALALGSFFMS